MAIQKTFSFDDDYYKKLEALSVKEGHKNVQDYLCTLGRKEINKTEGGIPNWG